MKKITIFILAFVPFIGFAQKGTKDITILYTNDFHSAFDPIPAYWLKNSPKLGYLSPEGFALFHIVQSTTNNN